MSFIASWVENNVRGLLYSDRATVFAPSRGAQSLRLFSFLNVAGLAVIPISSGRTGRLPWQVSRFRGTVRCSLDLQAGGM